MHASDFKPPKTFSVGDIVPVYNHPGKPLGQIMKKEIVLYEGYRYEVLFVDGSYDIDVPEGDMGDPIAKDNAAEFLRHLLRGVGDAENVFTLLSRLHRMLNDVIAAERYVRQQSHSRH